MKKIISVSTDPELEGKYTKGQSGYRYKTLTFGHSIPDYLFEEETVCNG